MIESHTLSWPAVFEGRADIEIPPEGIVRIAEMAGAPWADHDPDAKLSPLQIEILTAPERTVVVFAGSRAGKSVIGACAALAQLCIPNSRVAIVGASFEHCAKEFNYVWRGFHRLFPADALTDAANSVRPPHFSMRMATAWGSELVVVSTLSKEGGQLLGYEFDCVILAESSHVESDVYHRKIERALLGRAKKRDATGYLRRTGRAYLLTTPAGQGGISYDLYWRAMQRTNGRLDKLRLESGAPWFDSFYFAQHDVRTLNPAYPQEAFDAARRTLPKAAFEEQMLGKAVARTGLVYSSFREDRHVLPTHALSSAEVLRRSTIGVGIDTGTNFAAVLAAMIPDGKVYVLDEVFNVGRNIRENAEDILEMVQRALGSVFTDPKQAIDPWVVDVASQNLLDLEEILDVTLFAQKWDVLDSLGHLDLRFANDQLFIAEDCDFLLNEIRNYRWKEVQVVRAIGSKAEGTIHRDRPVGQDHLLDAMRYLLMQFFETGPPQAEREQLSPQEILDRARAELLTPDLARDLRLGQQRRAIELWRGAW